MTDVKRKLFKGEEVYISSETCRLQYMYNDNSPALPCSGALLVTNCRALFISIVRRALLVHCRRLSVLS